MRGCPDREVALSPLCPPPLPSPPHAHGNDRSRPHREKQGSDKAENIMRLQRVTSFDTKVFGMVECFSSSPFSFSRARGHFFVIDLHLPSLPYRSSFSRTQLPSSSISPSNGSANIQYVRHQTRRTKNRSLLSTPHHHHSM